MPDRVIIAPRFCGPATSGNGGYSCGLLGTRLHGPAEVTLRKPPPLGRPLALEGQGELRLVDGDELIAEARAAPLPLDIPAAPDFARAEVLSTQFVARNHHPFPTCFVCGINRAAGDGLRIFAGREGHEGPVAAPWIPHASLAGPGGEIPDEVLWAALDCPGYFGGVPPSLPVAVLGRMTAEVTGRVRVGERCVVIGWGLGVEGRKIHAGTALFGEDGQLRGRARQTWITIT